MKLFSRLARRRREADGDSRAPDPEQRANLAREEKFYGVDQLSTLDAQGLMKALMIHRHHPISAQLDSLRKRYSMLHCDVLTVLYYLAKHADGNVLEIGSFLGGSTIATAIGLRERDQFPSFVTVEKGGKLIPRRKQLVTYDIVRDLKRNLRKHGLATLVQVVVGASLDNETAAAVRAHLPPRSVGIFIIDADGEVRSLLDVYQELLADHCWLVIDDYHSVGPAAAKSARTKPQIDAAVATGELEELGFYGWGTWIGRWHRQPRPAPDG